VRDDVTWFRLAEVAVLATLSLAAAGCSDDEPRDASAKPATSISPAHSSATTADPSTSATHAASARPMTCLTGPRVSTLLHTQVVLVSSTPANGTLRCTYLSATGSKKALVLNLADLGAEQSRAAYTNIAGASATAMGQLGDDAGLGAESVFIGKKDRSVLVARADDGTTIVLNLFAPGALQFRSGLHDLANAAFDSY
jgi:hypothetical protein